MPNSYQDFISKPEISFWIPIIFSAVSITISFMSLSAKQDLISQKLDTIIEKQQGQLVWKDKFDGQVASLYGRVGLAESNIKVITSRINNYFKTDQ